MARENLIKARKNKGLRQIDAAQYLEIDRTTYVKYETGSSEPDFDTIKKLAEYYGTTTSYLIGETDDPSIPNQKKELPTIEEALERQGVTDAAHVKTIKELVELMRKAENNAEVSDEISIKGLNENRRA